jgi:hypothetical protein
VELTVSNQTKNQKEKMFTTMAYISVVLLIGLMAPLAVSRGRPSWVEAIHFITYKKTTTIGNTLAPAIASQSNARGMATVLLSFSRLFFGGDGGIGARSAPCLG